MKFRLTRTLLTSVILCLVMVNFTAYAGAVFPTTFIILNAVDAETEEFVGGPVTIEIIEEFQGAVVDSYSFTLIEPNQRVTVGWSTAFMPEGVTIRLVASRDGYIPSEPYIFAITEMTPVEGLIFDHTFILQKEVSDKPQIINAETHLIELHDKQFEVETVSSSKIIEFSLNENTKSLKIIVEETSTDGFLNVSIPTTFMEGPFTVIIDNILTQSFSQNIQGSTVLISIPYLMGIHDVTIKSETITQPEKPTTEIDITISSDMIQLDEMITISGRIIPPEAKTDVSVIYTSPGGVISVRTVATLADGGFGDNFIPDEAGSWKVYAQLLPDDDPITSSELIFTVRQSFIEPEAERAKEEARKEVEKDVEKDDILLSNSNVSGK